MDTTLFHTEFENEQISAEIEYSLIAQAQKRYQLLTTGQNLTLEDKKTIRRGERALERLLASQAKQIESRIQKLLAKLPTLNREDLRQSAQEGIIKAIHSFDLSKGFRLITWAWYQISSKFKQQVTGEVTQSKAESSAKTQTPVAQDNTQIEVLQLDSVQKVIAKFKQPIQKIIELRTQGYEFPEIGKFLGKTADACRMGYNRAIQRIRQILIPSETVYPATPSTQWMTRLKLRFGKNVRFRYRPRHNDYRVQRKSMTIQKASTRFPTWVSQQTSIDWASYLFAGADLTAHALTPGGLVAIPLYGVTAIGIASLMQYRSRLPAFSISIGKNRLRLKRKASFLAVLSLIAFAFASASLSLFQPAHALFFDTIGQILKALIGLFGVQGLDNVPNYVAGGLAMFGLVLFASQAIKFLRYRENDPDAYSDIIQGAIKVFVVLAIGDVILSFFRIS
jgi:RNA polymerase sigma factor (sigma-70 family)